MSNTISARTASRAAVSLVDTTEDRETRVLEQRAAIRTRHARALSGLMEERADLRGVHALADLVDDAVRWSA